MTEMPKQVIFALLIQCALIVMTTTLLAQPRIIFSDQSNKVRSIARGGGWVLLCITFCWSVVFGVILSLNAITIRI
jgi:hypothetical protein